MMGYFVLLFIVRQIDLTYLSTSLYVIMGLVENENPGSINADGAERGGWRSASS